MKAIQIQQCGGTEQMELQELPDPKVSENTACVELEWAGVNYIDTYHRTGLYPIELPRVLGLEGAGRITALQGESLGLTKGTRVAFALGTAAYAEQTIVPLAHLVPVPDEVPLDVACALMIQGMTAHYLACSTWPLQKGERCLIHAAAGGVGQLLVQIAKRRGAVVLATMSTEEKQQKVTALGADHCIRYTECDFVEEVARLTDGAGVSVVYDSVGKSTFEQSLQCLRPRGMLVSFGQSSGAIGEFNPLALGSASLFLTRPRLHDYVANREELLQRASELFRWYQQGELQVEIGRTFPLADAAAAHQALEGRQTSGKVLLKIA